MSCKKYVHILFVDSLGYICAISSHVNLNKMYLDSKCPKIKSKADLLKYKPNVSKSNLIHLSTRPVMELIFISKLLDEYNIDYIPIMMIRSPLKTILSGYNYHGSGIY